MAGHPDAEGEPRGGRVIGEWGGHAGSVRRIRNRVNGPRMVVNCGPVTTLSDLIVPSIRIGPLYKVKLSRMNFGVIGIYADRIVTGRVAGDETLPLAAYQPDGATALAGYKGVKDAVTVPLADIVSVHIRAEGRKRTRMPGFRLEIVPLDGEPVVHFLLYEDARWPIVALRHLLGERVVEDAISAGLTINAEPPAPDSLRPVKVKPHVHKEKKRALPLRHPMLGVVCKVLGVIAFIAGYLAWQRGTLTYTAVTGNMVGAELFGLLLIFYCMAGTLLIYLGYRLSLKSAETIIANDQRAPIVYLRSFQDDGRNTFNPTTPFAAMLGLEPGPLLKKLGPLANINPLRLYRLLRGFIAESAEEQLASVLSARGPFVAIGKPGEALSHGGAARFYVANESWQDTVRRLVAQAQIVVLQPANTAGVWWEVDYVMRNTPPERILISLVNYRNKQGAYDNLRVRMGQEYGVVLPPSASHASFLWFSTDWSSRALPGWYRSPFKWPVARMAVDMPRTLAPYIASLDGAPAPPAAMPKNISRKKQFVAVYVWVAIGIALNYALSSVIYATGIVSPERAVARHIVKTLQESPSARTYHTRRVLATFALDTLWRITHVPDENLAIASYIFQLSDHVEFVLNAHQSERLYNGAWAGPTQVMEDAMNRVRNVMDNVEVISTRDVVVDNHTWQEALVHATSRDSTRAPEELVLRAYGGVDGEVQIFTIVPQRLADIYEPVLQNARMEFRWISLADYINWELSNAQIRESN